MFSWKSYCLHSLLQCIGVLTCSCLFHCLVYLLFFLPTIAILMSTGDVTFNITRGLHITLLNMNHIFGQKGWPATHHIDWLSSEPQLLSLLLQCWDHKNISPCTTFFCIGCKDRTQVLMHARETFYSLRYVLCPIIVFKAMYNTYNA